MNVLHTGMLDWMPWMYRTYPDLVSSPMWKIDILMGSHCLYSRFQKCKIWKNPPARPFTFKISLLNALLQTKSMSIVCHCGFHFDLFTFSLDVLLDGELWLTACVLCLLLCLAFWVNLREILYLCFCNFTWIAAWACTTWIYFEGQSHLKVILQTNYLMKWDTL